MPHDETPHYEWLSGLVFTPEQREEADALIEALGWRIQSVEIEPRSERNPWGIKEYRSEADLIVIDHLHYFDLPDGENELAQTTKIVREIKKFTDDYSTPVLLVSHLRKKYRDRGSPNIEDLHGSSNIPKIASTVILTTPNYGDYDHVNLRYGTFMRIAKSRSGIKPNVFAMIRFDGKLRKYEDKYEIWKVGLSNEPERMNENEWPSWATRNGQRFQETIKV